MEGIGVFLVVAVILIVVITVANSNSQNKAKPSNIQKTNKPDNKNTIGGGIENSKDQNEIYPKAVKAFENENWSLAIELFSKAINIEPLFEAYFQRGIARTNLKQWNEAIEDFNIAIRIRPDGAFSDQAFYTRGVSKGSLENFSGAIDDFNRALRVNSTNQDVLCTRGLTYLRLGERDNALSDLIKASELGSHEAKKILQMING